MLTKFAYMVKTNQIKLRSKRTIAELDTWIYKGTAARIDHQDGAHDDTLTCLSMAMFVMTYSMGKIQKAKDKDKVLLKAWKHSQSITKETENATITVNTEIVVKPKKHYPKPFYKAKDDNIRNPYGWMMR